VISHFLFSIFEQVSGKPISPQTASVESRGSRDRARHRYARLSRTRHATSGGDTVQGLYDELLGTMKSGRSLGQTGRFARLERIPCSRARSCCNSNSI
jgi:hypothetical protein